LHFGPPQARQPGAGSGIPRSVAPPAAGWAIAAKELSRGLARYYWVASRIAPDRPAPLRIPSWTEEET